MKIKKYLDLAYKLALQSEKYPRVGAVIFKKNTVLSIGHNIKKSHPLQKKLNYLRFSDNYFDSCNHEQHAEFVACNIYKKDLTGSSIAVVRIDFNGTILPSYPCKACQALLKERGIKTIITKI